MGHRELTFEVHAPPERVYALLVDADRMPEWMIGLKTVTTTGPLDRPGSEATLKFGGPFTVRSRVTETDPGVRHELVSRELLGLVTCTTATTLSPAGGGTRVGVDFDFVVAGGPVGRLFDGMVGGEITGRAGKEYERLAALAEGRPTEAVGKP